MTWPVVETVADDALCHTGCVCAVCIDSESAMNCVLNGRESVEPPRVLTLFATDYGGVGPRPAAVGVTPKCVVAFGEELASRSLVIMSRGIQAVDSYPVEATRIVLRDNAIQSFKAVVGSALQTLDLSSNGITNFGGSFAIPASVTELFLDGNTIEQLSASNLPSQLKTLSLRETGLQSLSSLRFPASLVSLSLDGSSKLSDLTGLVLPPRLETLSVLQSPIQSITGVRFPNTLTTLKLGGAVPITTFDVHASDFPVLQAAKLTISGGTRISKCSNTRGRVTTLQPTYSVCVYEDDAFGKPGTGASSSAQSTSGSNSIDPEDSGAGSTVSDLPSGGSKPSTAGGSSDSPPTNSTRDSPTAGADTGTKTTDSSGRLSTHVLIVAVIATLVVGLIVSVIVRRKRRAKQGMDDNCITTSDHSNNKTASSSDPSTSSLTVASSIQSLAYDIRDDPLLIPRRVLYEHLTITAEIGQGGFGIVYRAKLHDSDVVVKRLAQNNRQQHSQASTSDALRRFMDEIRLSAVVEHPTIVAFVGVAWTTLLDLSLILEYLPNGDLYGHLRRHKQQLTWLREDGDSDDDNSHGRLRLRCKAALAIDIVDALVYLHAWSPLPIVHRDLKARNVLLSSEFRAKLCDFGVSREAMLNETMTGGVGTTAWIAPEVLQGERYSEKADIYSLGMVLCEMDVCGHPYNHDVSVQEEMADAQIACLVSAGQLKPTLRADCPAVVRQLIMQCVEYEATRRPSAREVLVMLQEAMRK